MVLVFWPWYFNKKDILLLRISSNCQSVFFKVCFVSILWWLIQGSFGRTPGRRSFPLNPNWIQLEYSLRRTILSFYLCAGRSAQYWIVLSWESCIGLGPDQEEKSLQVRTKEVIELGADCQVSSNYLLFERVVPLRTIKSTKGGEDGHYIPQWGVSAKRGGN